MIAARCRPASLAAYLAAGMLACGGGDPDDPAASSVAVDVFPPSATLAYHEALQLDATVTGAAIAEVSWSTDCGSVSQTGLYTAPGTDASCRVVATSLADTTKSGSATVTVTGGAGQPSSGWPATCAAEPLRQTGTTYYFCDCQAGADAGCAPGNDANAGTSPGAPKRTWAAAITAFNGLPAGGTVALCKGGRWTAGDQTIRNAACAPDPACPLASRVDQSCTPSTTCDLRDYQAPWGGTSKPLVSGGATLWMGGGTVANSDGYRMLNLSFYGTPGTFPALRPDNYASDFEVCNVQWDNFGAAAYIELPESSACQTILDAGGNKRHYWRGNRVLGMSGHGILIEESDSVWDGNFIDYAPGTCSDLNHPLYHANNWCRSSNWTFKNNEVRNRKCAGSTAVYSSKASRNYVIENNLIDETGATSSSSYAVGIDLGTWNSSCNSISSECGHTNAIIRGNRILMNKGMGINVDSGPGTLIENNVIIYVAGSSQPADGEAAIMAPHYYNEGSESASTNVMVRNNTVYVSGASGTLSGFDNTRSSNATARVYNNSFVKASGTMSLTCLQGSSSRILGHGNNHCYGYDSLGYGTGWLTSAPAFDAPGANLVAADFTPLVGSPLEDAGSTASTCTVRGVANQPCYASTAITPSPWSPASTAGARGASPDVGAFER